MEKQETLRRIAAYFQAFIVKHDYPPLLEEVAKACKVTVLTADIALDLLRLQKCLDPVPEKRTPNPFKPTATRRKRRTHKARSA